MKVKFLTLGCKVNQYETQGLAEKFLSLGHSITAGIADCYVINTCTVTASAASKSKKAILKAKKENPKARIAVCGCLVQLNSESLEKAGVDHIIGQDKKHKLPEIVSNSRHSCDDKGIWSLKISHFFNHRAFIKVQDGCDNFCSFCKIPHLRGPSQSRDGIEAIEEVKRVAKLHKEIVLCGINLSLYGRDLKPRKSLEGLIESILDIPYLGRLRLSSLEPFFLNRKLFSFLHNPKLCPHFHFPFQYGDDRILKEMNKKEDVALYAEVVENIRKINPHTAISCDIMVGFPYEDEESFKNTVAFLNRIRPMRMHIFTFSPREKTKFYGIKITNQKDVRRRYNFLKRMANDFSLEYKKKFLGKTLNMVAETKYNGFTCGYTENYIKVYVKGEAPLGQIVPVRIKKVDNNRVYAA